MILALCIGVPILFVIGLAYSAFKEQRRLEQDLLKPLIQKRKEQRQKLLEYYSNKGDLKNLEALRRRPLFDSYDDENDN